jgi:hypothetical protein
VETDVERFFNIANSVNRNFIILVTLLFSIHPAMGSSVVHALYKYGIGFAPIQENWDLLIPINLGGP